MGFYPVGLLDLASWNQISPGTLGARLDFCQGLLGDMIFDMYFGSQEDELLADYRETLCTSLGFCLRSLFLVVMVVSVLSAMPFVAPRTAAQNAPTTPSPVLNGQAFPSTAKRVGQTGGARLGSLKPGCGFEAKDQQSCWRAAKAGQKARGRCAQADLSVDPWQESSRATARPLRMAPRWELPRVATAGNRRYGWQDPRPPGYWPLGGPVDEPWAESLPTLEANLRWACENVRNLPSELRSRMGDPSTHDMELHPREIYDLVFLGGARDLLQLIKAARVDPEGTPPTFRNLDLTPRAEISWRPAHPRVGEEVIFFAKDQGPGTSYNWLVNGRRHSGPHVRQTFKEVGEVKIRLQLRRSARGASQVRSLTIAPAGPDPSRRPGGIAPETSVGSRTRLPPCPPGMSCTYQWREDLGRHEIRRFRPSLRSTGSLDLEVQAAP